MNSADLIQHLSLSVFYGVFVHSSGVESCCAILSPVCKSSQLFFSPFASRLLLDLSPCNAFPFVQTARKDEGNRQRVTYGAEEAEQILLESAA